MNTKIKSINEAKLGITIVEEILISFTLEELKAMSLSEFIDAIDVLNAYEEEWQYWKNSGVLELYKYAYEVLTTQLLGELI